MKKILLFSAVLALVLAAGVSVVRADNCELVDISSVCGAGVPQNILEAMSATAHKQDAVINNWFDSYRAGVLLPVPTNDYFVEKRINEFLASDEAAQYHPVPASEVSPSPVAKSFVLRDVQDNFFLDGRHIELPEFKALRINADWVLRGVKILLSSVVVR